MYFEKATKVCEISTVDLSYVVPVKSTVEILQNFVAFLEYMNFNEEKLRQEVFMRFWNNILEWAACNFTIWLMLMDTKLFAKAASAYYHPVHTAE